MKRTLVLVLLLATAACERGAQQQKSAADTARADTAQATATLTTRPDSAMAPGVKFDAAQAKQGDKIAGLEIASKNIKATPETPIGVTGSVSFKGELQLRGSYRRHYDYPVKKDACFWVDPNDWSKLPRVKGDERVEWFCFTNNDEAIRQLGPLGTEMHATIVVDDYTTNIDRADVADMARLVRVVEKHK